MSCDEGWPESIDRRYVQREDVHRRRGPTEFRILGPLEFNHFHTIVSLGGPRERTVLAMLLLEANHVIGFERLIDAVWDERPPATARGQIQICISSLRRRILAVCGLDLIETRSPGYLLRIEPGTIDLHQFEALVTEGHVALANGEPERATQRLRSALALWRGDAACGVTSRVVQAGVTRLNERRLVVLGECLNLEMETGAHHELIGELTELVNEHPLHEHFRVLLMTALYRAGRQVEALETYRRSRDVLMDELGIEPGEELRRLHQAMLTHAVPPGDAEQSRVNWRAQAGVNPRGRKPHLLPAAIPDFIGHRPVIRRLLEQLRGASPQGDGHAVRVSVITGQGGAGKTTLGVHVAHLLASNFPDGQLFARLRAGNRPIHPANILERFLRALGVDSEVIPDGDEERAELFRDLLGDRRILIVLDDAMTEQQVAALLPGTALCAVIVTTRRRLTGLSSVGRVEIGAFSMPSSVELLSRVVGVARIQAEPASVEQLCQLCGNLPLALRIVAARLAARPHWSVASLVDRLVDESGRLDQLHHSEMDVRASISLTYEGLSPDARTLFRRLALFDSPSFASWMASPLLQADVLHAQDVVEELIEAYLIDIELGPGDDQLRYRVHTLTRPFAHERLIEENAEDGREALDLWFGTLLALIGGNPCAPPLAHALAGRGPQSERRVGVQLKERLAWIDAAHASFASHENPAEVSLEKLGVALFEARAAALGQVSAGDPSGAMACWKSAAAVLSRLNLQDELALSKEVHQLVADPGGFRLSDVAGLGLSA